MSIRYFCPECDQTIKPTDLRGMAGVECECGLIGGLGIDLKNTLVLPVKALERMGCFLSQVEIHNARWVNDFSAISKCINANKIAVYGCNRVVSLAFLGGLHRLEEVVLQGCDSLRDISALSNLSDMKKLVLGQCRAIQDISAIMGLHNLTELIIGGCAELEDISPISGLVNLETLIIGGSGRIKSLVSLSGLRSLVTLAVSLPSLCDISALRDMRSLQKLALIDCKEVTDASVISQLVELRELRLSGCESIEDIMWLKSLEHIRHVDLQGCAISQHALGGVADKAVDHYHCTNAVKPSAHCAGNKKGSERLALA